MQFEETWAALLGVLSSPPIQEENSTEVDLLLKDLLLPVFQEFFKQTLTVDSLQYV